MRPKALVSAERLKDSGRKNPSPKFGNFKSGIRTERGRLPDKGVSGEESWKQLSDADGKRKVPWNNTCNYAKGDISHDSSSLEHINISMARIGVHKVSADLRLHRQLASPL